MNLKYLLAGAGTALALYSAYYLTQPVPSQDRPKSLSKSNLISLLQELEKELTPYLITLASFSQSIQSRLATNDLSKISEVLQSHCPIFNDLKRIEVEVCNKYGLTPEDFKFLCEDEFRADEDVKQRVLSIKNMNDAAITGIAPKINYSLPVSITPELVLRVTKDLYDATVFVTCKKTKEILKSGEKFSLASEKYQNYSSEMHQETEKIKEKVYQMHDFNSFALPPKTVHHQAVQLYKTIPSFIEGLQVLEREFQNSLVLITSGNYPEHEFEKLAERFDDRVIWELETPRQIIEAELFEYINN